MLRQSLPPLAIEATLKKNAVFVRRCFLSSLSPPRGKCGPFQRENKVRIGAAENIIEKVARTVAGTLL